MLVCLPIHCEVLSSMQALSPLKHFNFSLQTSNSTHIALWFIMLWRKSTCVQRVFDNNTDELVSVLSDCEQCFWGRSPLVLSSPTQQPWPSNFIFTSFVLLCLCWCACCCVLTFYIFCRLNRHFSSGYFTVHKALSSVKTNRAIYKLCVIWIFYSCFSFASVQDQQRRIAHSMKPNIVCIDKICWFK